MTREEFLKTHWTPYPQPQTEHWRSGEWSFGKVAQKNGAKIHLVGVAGPFESRFQQCCDASFGNEIPSELLQTGDVIAYQRPTGAVFLLSPNLLPQEGGGQLESCNALISWQVFLETVRAYFNEQGFRYWQTPNLLLSPGIDAHIDFFKVQGVRSQRTYFLPTSPEFALKKAIADGETKIFEIKPCFRDDDPSPTHSAEFLMLEWYRAYADKWELYTDFLNLVEFVVKKMELPFSLDFSATKVSMAEVFAQKLNFQLTPQTTQHDLQELLKKHQLDSSSTDDWDDLFFRLYIEFIETDLGAKGPQALYNFPFSQGSLARKTVDGWADRFEIYWQGIELANAYQEQNDPQAMEERYQSEIEKRLHAGKQPHPQDSQFLQKMRQGFPPCAGIALGLDRLWKVLNKKFL